MSLHILDTDMLTLFQHGNPSVCRKVQQHKREELAVTIISVEEQLSGWYTRLRRAKHPAELARVYDLFTQSVRFLSRLNVVSFSEPAILRFEQLKRMKLKVSAMDLRIATIVLESVGILVTRNVQDFQRVPDLLIENWAE